MREAGKKVFLLTNSLWDYTNVVMNYLQAKKEGDAKDLKWAEYFDIIIVGGNKPAFLLDDSLPLYRVDPATGALQNIEIPVPQHPAEVHEFLERGKFFQGGNAQLLHRLLTLPAGDTLLYVGDHIYSDVLRSKRSLNWRTCLIVPELAHEIKTHKKLRLKRKELLELRKHQYMLENTLNILSVQILKIKREMNSESSNETPGRANREELLASLQKLERESEELTKQLSELKPIVRAKLIDFDANFHPRWGQLFKAGFQESRIAKQIKDFACLYTSKASNLGLISPKRPLRPVRDKMPHDHIIDGI